MRLYKLLSLLLCLSMLLVGGCGDDNAKTKADGSGAYLTMTDAAGRQVVLPKKPERVVSLSPSYLSLIEAVDGKIIGRATSKTGTIPESMKSVAEVGFVYNVNTESVVGLKPDLVLASKSQHEKLIPLLESNKINVVEFDAKTYDEVKKTITMLGDIYGTADKAKAENATTLIL